MYVRFKKNVDVCVHKESGKKSLSRVNCMTLD